MYRARGKDLFFQCLRKRPNILALEDDASVQDVLNALNEQFGERYKKETGNSLMESFEGFFNVARAHQEISFIIQIKIKFRGKKNGLL